MNDERLEKNLLISVIAFLKEQGYPDNAILSEPIISFNNRIYRPDILIVDPNTKDILAIIEVKGVYNYRLQLIKSQLAEYRKILNAENIPAFVVLPSVSEHTNNLFDIYWLKDNGDIEKLDKKSFPNLEKLSIIKAVKKKGDLSEKRRLTARSFERLSKTVAVMLIVLGFSDFICSFYGLQLLTPERMTLVGGAVVLLIIPYAQKFKGLGIEWEGMTDERLRERK